MLTKEQILAAKDSETKTVPVPQWGGDVLVKSMTGTERDAFESAMVQGKKRDFSNIRAKLCSVCMVDDKGNRLFNDREVSALGKKSACALDLVFGVCQELNGMTDKDVEELEKNSGAIQAEDSTSD